MTDVQDHGWVAVYFLKAAGLTCALNNIVQIWRFWIFLLLADLIDHSLSNEVIGYIISWGVLDPDQLAVSFLGLELECLLSAGRPDNTGNPRLHDSSFLESNLL